MQSEHDLAPGWLTQFRRGVFSGAGMFLLAVVGCTIPAFLVWLMPGTDSSPASTTVKAGVLLALSAVHGGLWVSGVQFTLSPLLVTAALGWLVANQARRADSWSSAVGLPVGYAILSGLAAGWAHLGATRAPGWRSALAGFAFVAVVGSTARGWDAIGPRLRERQRRIGRAVAAVLACYTGAGALLIAGSLLLHLHQATDMQRTLAPGAAGLPIVLLGIAASPNAILAAVGLLTGPGFGIGSGTHVSVVSVEHGRLPVFPLLAAVPAGTPAPALTLVLVAVLALVAGFLAARCVTAGAWTARLVDLTAVAVLVGGVLAAGSGLAAGGVGDGGLAAVGASWWRVGIAAPLLLLTSVALWSAFELARAHRSHRAGRDSTIEDFAGQEPGTSGAPAVQPVDAGTASEAGRARLRVLAGRTEIGEIGSNTVSGERESGDRSGSRQVG